MEKLSRFIKNGDENINVLYGPLSSRTLYILIRKKVKKGILGKFRTMYVFRDKMIPDFESRYISGIPLIEKIYPVSSSVWDRSVKSYYIVYRKSYLPKGSLEKFNISSKNTHIGSFWDVQLSRKRMYEFKIEHSENENLFKELLESLGLQYYFYEPYRCIIYNMYSIESIADFVHSRKNGCPSIHNSSSVFSFEEKRGGDKSLVFSDPKSDFISKYPFKVEVVDGTFYILIDNRDIEFIPRIESKLKDYIFNKGYGILLKKSRKITEGEKTFTAIPFQGGALKYHKDIRIIREDVEKRNDIVFFLTIEEQIYIFSRSGYLNFEVSYHLKKNSISVSYKDEDILPLYFY